MYQTINDSIDVVGYFSQGKFYPRKFRWQQKTYDISEVTLSAFVRDGGVRQQFYSVVVAANVYRLCHNLENQQWQLREVWCEG